MATLRDTYVLEIQTRGAESALTNLRGKLGLLGGAIAALGLTRLASDAVNTFTEFERLTTQIATYTGGIDAARQEMARLEELSFSLPQDLNDLAEAFTILTRSGIETTTENIRSLSEVAAANGRSMTQLAEAVADAMVGEFERFKEFGIKVTREGDQLVARVGDQTVAVGDSAAEITQRLIALGEEGGRFAGAAAANADTLSQSFSNLNGVVSIAQRAFVEGLKPGLQAIVEQIGLFIMNNRDLLTSIGSLIGSGLNVLASILQTLSPLFEVLGLVITPVIDILGFLFDVVARVVDVLRPIAEVILSPLSAAFRLVGQAVEAVINFFERMIGVAGRMLERLRSLFEGINNFFGDIATKASESAQSVYNSVTGWFGRMYDRVVGNSIIPDMAREVIAQFRLMNTSIVQDTERAVVGVTNATQNVASAISTNLNSMTSTAYSGLNGIATTLGNAITQRLQGYASQISSTLGNLWSQATSRLGSIGNLFSGFNLGGIFRNLFAGFFANGGFIPKGQFGVVGERGPELVSGPANVTPLTGAMQPQQVIYNINAVDASSFRSLLARDPAFVHSVVQRGARGMGGRR